MGTGQTMMALTGPLALAMAAPALVLIDIPDAAAQSQTQFDVPAGRLSSAVRQVARQAGISIATRESGLRSIRSRAIRGRMSAGEALRQLLAGTPFRAVAIGGGNFRIERRPPAPRTRQQPTSPAPPSPPPPPPQPIIVEATKRATALSEYPGGVKLLDVALQGSNSAGARLDTALAAIPTVSGTALGPGRNKIFVRGIADSSFNGPTQATIGLYLGEQRLIFSAPNPDLRMYDVGGVELLEGPQGTLYGAGAIAGLLRIKPNQPDPGDLQAASWASAATTKGGDESWDLAGMVNIPVSDSAAIRVVGYGGREGGYIDDPDRNQENINSGQFYGARGALSFDLGPDWNVELTGFGQYNKLDDGQYSDASLSGLQRTDLVRQPFEGRIYGGSLTINGYLGDVELVSTTGLVDHYLRTVFDSSVLTGDPSRQSFRETREIRLITHETRLAGGDPDEFDWVLGVGALRDRDDMRQLLTNLDGDNPPPFAELTYRLDEIAAFGEARYHLTPNLAATAGGRLLYTRATGERSFGPDTIVEPREGPARFLPAIALAWEPGHGLMAYLRYQHGFRTGGVTIERDQDRNPQTARFDPDKVRSYEAGLRASIGEDQPVELALTLHHSDWHDIQADLVDLQGFPITRNIGDGDIFGADISAQWQSDDGWSLAAAAGFNEAESDRLLPSGSIARLQIPNVPDLALSGRIAKDWSLGTDGSVGVSLAGRYVGSSTLDIDQQVRVEQGDYATLDGSIRWRRKGLEIKLDALNLTNSHGNRFAFGNPFTVRLEDQATPLRPMTFRLGVSLKH